MSDLEQDKELLAFSALVSSKICHDIIGPVGAMFNGFEVLEEDDSSMADYAMEVIRNNAAVVRDQLALARFMYGAGGAGSDTSIDELKRLTSESLSQKLTVNWDDSISDIPRSLGKLILIYLVIANKALVRGGQIDLTIDKSETAYKLTIDCTGDRIILKPEIAQILMDPTGTTPDALTIQAHLAARYLHALKGVCQITNDEDNKLLIQVSAPFGSA